MPTGVDSSRRQRPRSLVPVPDRDTHPDADGERDVPDDADWSGTVPKLSVTHRVLAALPQLRRPSSDEPSTKDGGNGNGARTPTRPGRPAKNGSGTDPGGASGSGPGSSAEDSLATDVDTVDDEGVEDEEVEDEGVDAEVVQGELVDDETGTGPAPAGAGRRRDSFLRPRAQDAKHDPDADKTPAELVHMIKTIDDRERLYALFSAPLGAALGVAYTAEAIRTHPHALSGTILFQGLAPILFALILLVAVTEPGSGRSWRSCSSSWACRILPVRTPCSPGSVCG